MLYTRMKKATNFTSEIVDKSLRCVAGVHALLTKCSMWSIQADQERVAPISSEKKTANERYDINYYTELN